MKNEHFSFYKTLYLTRRNPYEIPEFDKDYYKSFYYNNFVNGQIELGKRYKVEVFHILEPWKLETHDYFNFFEKHKENLIGFQVMDVVWHNAGDYASSLVYPHGTKDLWVSEKKCLTPFVDLSTIPFYFYLGFIHPNYDADESRNYVFIFYPFEEGTEDLYEPLLIEEEKESLVAKNNFYDYHENEYDTRNCRDMLSENYLGLPGLF